MSNEIPKSTNYFQFKEHVLVEGEDSPRLITPWSDPNEHEFPMDLMWDTPEEAYEYIKEGIENENFELDEVKDWVLVLVELEPAVRMVDGKLEALSDSILGLSGAGEIEKLQKIID